MDITLRFDRQVAELLDFVDSRIGLDNTIVVFTSDHGVAISPKLGASIGLTSRVDNAEVLRKIRGAISNRYNPLAKSPDPTADYLYQYEDGGNLSAAILNNSVYFNLKALQRDNVNVEEIERVAGEAALTVPGVVRYFTRTDLIKGAGLTSNAGSR